MSMRIPSVPEAEAAGKLKVVYESVREAFGRVTPAFQAMSLEPDYLEAFWNLHQVVMREGRLPRREKETIALAVSAANRCGYCIAAHSARLRALGAGDAIVEALKANPLQADVGARSREILRLALKMTQSPAAIEDEDLEALRRQGLTDEQIFEAVAVAAHFNGLNRFLDAFGVTPLRPPTSVSGR